MGIREVRIYTCDGCKATTTLEHNTRARGWHTIKLDGKREEIILCMVCYGAVGWVIRFQGIMVPPKVHKGVDGRYRLRKQTLSDFPHQLGPDNPDEGDHQSKLDDLDWDEE